MIGQQVMRPIYAPCVQRGSSTPLTGLVASSEGEASHDFDERQAGWLGCCPNVLTPNEHVYRMYHQGRKGKEKTYSIFIPPFTGIYVPVMKPLSSLAKNAIALAMSSG